MSDAEGVVCSEEQRRISELEQALRSIRSYAGASATGSLGHGMTAWFACSVADAVLGADARPPMQLEKRLGQLESALWRIGRSAQMRSRELLSEDEFLETVLGRVRLAGLLEEEGKA